MASAAILAKAAAVVLTDEGARKKVGWALVVILSPAIVVLALICSLAAGTSDHNVSVAQMCFHGGAISSEVPDEYRMYIVDMRDCFELLDGYITAINGMAEGGASLDETRVKAIFYALYFGADDPSASARQEFADCFTKYETRTRTVTRTDEDGNEVEVEENYTVAIPITDLAEVYRNLDALLGSGITEEQKDNADSVYNLIRYGSTGGIGGGGIGGTDPPFIGADGFCSPVGENWREKVTSEFGYRKDPFTGKTKGHSGMDIAVPTGTSVRAALPGTVTVSKYNAGGYGYYVMIDHGGGLATLYGHCSQLLARVGQTVEAGDVIALSGSTGRSTGPHLHFEVRINGERTNPRSYLP